MSTFYIVLYFDKRYMRYLRLPNSSIYTRCDIDSIRKSYRFPRDITWIAQPINVPDWF